TGGYNSDGKEFFSYTDDLGDFTFFHSTWTGQNKYANNIKLYPKTNEITSEAFDYKNPKKGDKLIFKKLSNDDAYMDIQCNIFKGYDSRKQYKFFKISGEFMCDFNGGGSAQLFMLRDSTSSSATISEYPVKVESDGSVSLPGGIRFADAAAGGNCFKITMYLNLEDKTTTVLFGTGDDWKYNNFKMVTKEVPLTNKLSSLNIVRISCGAGAFTGEMQCRNVEVTGLDKEFIIGDSDVTEVATSMFDFDKDMAKDLDGKICFGYRVNSVFANGERYKLADEAVYTDNEFYISAEEFNKAYNVDAAVSGSNISYNGKTFAPKRIITADNGKALIPLKETAAELLSLNAFDDEEGLIVTSAQKIYFDKSAEVPYHKRYTPEDPWSNHYRYIDRPSDLQALYDYMMFDRPTSEQLLNGYRKMTADGKHHISVLATDKDFERIRELAKTDGYMKKVTDDLIAQADAVIKQKIRTYKYDDNFRTLNTARQLESWMQLVGFAYQITGEAKYAQYAMDQLTELKNFPDLNPIHIIDSGSYGTAIAVAYDWCYDYFTEEQREEIKETAYRLFLSVFPQAFYSRIPAKSVTSNDLTIVMPSICLKWYSNFNTWVNSGGVCMAAAF
ncbi:MAG: hypothetical protein Q4E94_06960, partial [Clostridia bacterium]|nr:hypothetical protein [Clostridia bacterium]